MADLLLMTRFCAAEAEQMMGEKAVQLLLDELKAKE